MDEANASYRSVGIQLQPRELQAGGWTADFILIEHRGSDTDETPYSGENTYATREDAKQAALDSARRIIDQRY